MIVHAGVPEEESMDTVAVGVDPVDEAIGSKMGTVHGVSDGEGQQCLGPTIWTEVYFGISPVEALVDTGFPATIVGLKFVLEVLAAQQDPGQSPPSGSVMYDQGCSSPLLPYRTTAEETEYCEANASQA